MQFEIEIRNLRKIYPSKLSGQLFSITMAALGKENLETKGGVALNNLNLSIRKGERVGIIGRNGAGKSTLLQILAGITEPTSGAVHILGKVTSILTLGIGLRDDLSGRENIYLDGSAQGKSRSDVDLVIQEIINFSDLGKFIDLPLRTYSTGMKARLAFSMITQIQPEILIIDEALSVGDAAFSSKAAKRISELCSKGAIVLIVSHSMQSIKQLCNRCLWLDSGSLMQDGTPDDVISAYTKSVYKDDEIDHIARFRYITGTASYKTGFELDKLSLSTEGNIVTKLVSGGPLQVSCQLKKPFQLKIERMVLSCIRLDGCLIFQNELTLLQGSQQIKALFPCLNLMQGSFCIQLEWFDQSNNLLAKSSSIIEIIADDVPAGGRPALINVGEIEGIRLNE
jgi:lipopolysaccharide transport system ATP-binding protein